MTIPTVAVSQSKWREALLVKQNELTGSRT